MGNWKAGTNYLPDRARAGHHAPSPARSKCSKCCGWAARIATELEPYIEAWSKKKPAYVKFVQEHVMWGPVHRAHGRLFYTLEALGRGDLVPKAFDEIHRRNNMLVSRTGNDAQTQSLQQAFAKANGVKEADFKREYNGFARQHPPAARRGTDAPLSRSSRCRS